MNLVSNNLNCPPINNVLGDSSDGLKIILINNLPDENIINIFSYINIIDFNNISQCTRKFRSFAVNPQFGSPLAILQSNLSNLKNRKFKATNFTHLESYRKSLNTDEWIFLKKFVLKNNLNIDDKFFNNFKKAKAKYTPLKSLDLFIFFEKIFQSNRVDEKINNNYEISIINSENQFNTKFISSKFLLSVKMNLLESLDFCGKGFFEKITVSELLNSTLDFYKKKLSNIIYDTCEIKLKNKIVDSEFDTDEEKLTKKDVIISDLLENILIYEMTYLSFVEMFFGMFQKKDDSIQNLNVSNNEEHEKLLFLACIMDIAYSSSRKLLTNFDLYPQKIKKNYEIFKILMLKDPRVISDSRFSCMLETSFFSYFIKNLTTEQYNTNNFNKNITISINNLELCEKEKYIKLISKIIKINSKNVSDFNDDLASKNRRKEKSKRCLNFDSTETNDTNNNNNAIASTSKLSKMDQTIEKLRIEGTLYSFSESEINYLEFEHPQLIVDLLNINGLEIMYLSDQGKGNIDFCFAAFNSNKSAVQFFSEDLRKLYEGTNTVQEKCSE